MVDIAKAVAPRKGLVQAVGASLDVLKTMRDKGGARVLCSYGAGPDMATATARRSALDEMCKGRDTTAISQVRSSGLIFTLRMFNADMNGLAHMFASPNSPPSLGDAGAHVSQIMDAGWASFVLSYWVRQRGLFTSARK